MERCKNWLLNEFWIGYSVIERLFLFTMVLLQVIVYMIAPDSWLSMIAGLAGVISVVLCAKGKLSFYFIGFIQTGICLWLTWDARFYGEFAENIFYLVTMIWGIFIWKKNMNTNDDGSQQVKAKKFTVKQWFSSITSTIALTLGLGYGLTLIDSAQAYTDAATNVLALFAQILMIKGYREQWIYWIIIDVLCLKMWFVDGNWSMVAMYIAWTINCLYGWYNWTKLNRKAA